MPRPGLTHPSMLLSLDGAWPSTCTIQVVKTVLSVSNQPVIGGTGTTLIAKIPCRIGPLIEVRPTDNERRSPNVLESYTERACKLSGYYPQIIPRTHRAVVDGVTYQIRGVEHDSQRLLTRLLLELVKPSHG